MATTTNYSWTTPDDTALVKDGAAAIRSLGTAIDSTVFTNAGAAIAKSIVDAKGDIIAATAADTVARLAVGANDTVLTADSSTATGLKWASPAAGGITLLSTTSITTSSTTVSGINQTYKDLIIRVDGPKMTSASGDELTVRFNSITTSSYHYTRYTTTSTSFTNFSAQTSYKFNNLFLGTAANNTYAQIDIPDYANTATKKSITAISQDESTSTLWMVGNLDSTGAISSVTITNALGLAMDGGTIRIYGVK